MNKCTQCWRKDANLSKVYHPTNFTGDKDPQARKLIYCSKGCIKNCNKTQQEAIIHLAELDQSMNYCEWFVRDNWNDGRYIRDGKEYFVNWLWDYKSWNIKNKYWNTMNHFIENFNRDFPDTDWFKLHNRYKWK